MRILAIVPGYATRKTRKIYLFAKKWFEAFPDDHEIQFLSLTPKDSEYLAGKYPVQEFNLASKPKILLHTLSHPNNIFHSHGQMGSWLKFQKNGKTLGKIINEGNFDIVSSVFAAPAGLLSACARKYHDTPISITGIGTDVAQIPEINYGATLDNKMRDVISWALQQADGLVGISEDAKQNMINLGVKKTIDVASLGTYIDVPQSKLDTNTIVFIGRFQARKNIKNLVKVAIEVCKENKEAKFLLAGEGPDYEWAIETVTSSNLERRIRFLGTPHDVTHLYEQASIYFHPSFHEGFGLVNAEAMAHGVPVVTTNTGATPEVVGNAGFMYDPHDIDGMKNCLLDLLNDDKKREEYGKKARQRIIDKDFTWDGSAKRLLKHFERVIDEHNS